jgi:hypothetical protein
MNLANTGLVLLQPGPRRSTEEDSTRVAGGQLWLA